MGLKRTCLAVFFWMKASAAFSIAVVIFALYITEIISLRNAALLVGDNTATPITGIGAGTTAATACVPNPASTGKLVPPTGYTYYGFSLPWQTGTLPTDTIPLFGGRRSAIFNAYFTFDMTQTPMYDVNNLNWKGSEAAKLNAILQVTIDPQNAGVTIPDSAFAQLADNFASINALMGVPILVRYGHEMNGYWYVYGGRPLAYIQGFQALSRAVRARTNVTAMLWSPNVGINYPYNGAGAVPAGYQTKLSNAAEFAALDTNADGVLSTLDDPYLPYYPGDEYVDWVGLSLYFYPVNGVNSVPGDNIVVSSINGDASAVVATRPMYDFYTRFSAKSGKPFILAESGSPFIVSAAAGPGELAIKQPWWTQTLQLPALYPNLKAIVNFEESKGGGADQGGDIRDYRQIFSTTPAVVSAFNAAMLPYDKSILQGNQVKYQCDGSVSLK